MARRIYNFEKPDRFVAGAVGQPGNRTFFLQAREGDRIVSVVLEKVQVNVLAEHLAQLLAEARARGTNLPEEPAPDDIDTAPLEDPAHIVFRVGTMTIVWDGDDESVVVEARALTDDDDLDDEPEAEAVEEADDVEDDSDMIRVHLAPLKALAFAHRALQVVTSGRPPCPFCGQPLNPEGHICARRNGFMH
ncbi:MAG TPA: DUF3090 family protein [Candidatus Limnocylindrales bacterium]